MAVTQKMVRKQFLISPATARRLEKLAKDQGTSASDIVRQAIDTYDERSANAMSAGDLNELVAARLKDAIRETRRARRQVSKTLRTLSEAEAD